MSKNIDIARYIDHTNLYAYATKSDIKKLCDEAIKYNFYSVCINPSYVSYAKELLKDTNVKITTVVGFPLGMMNSYDKAEETQSAIFDGADEIDMVINVGRLKDKDYKYLEDEIKLIRKASFNHILKVIIETCYLTDEEKEIITNIIINCGADFVKTSTGFGTKGATVEDIKLLNKIVNGRIKIKAAGGIHSLKDAQDMISNGATRLGVSKSVQIMEEYYDSNSTQRM
jgi:deoxyribose-phosphate aldolase